MPILKSTRELYIVSESFYPKGVIIMNSIDKYILKIYEINKKNRGKIILDVIKKSWYKNPLNFMLSWWDMNIIHTDDSISKDKRHIISTDFGQKGSYGSMFQARCTGYNTYTCPRKFIRYNITSIQLLLLKNNINFH